MTNRIEEKVVQMQHRTKNVNITYAKIWKTCEKKRLEKFSYDTELSKLYL